MIKSYLVTWGKVNGNLPGVVSQIDNYSIINSDAPENPDWHNLGMVWYYKQFHFAISDFIDNQSEEIMCWYATDATSPHLREIFDRAGEVLSTPDNWIYAPHLTSEAWTEGATKLKYYGNDMNYASQTDGIMVFFHREAASLMKEYMDYLDSKEKLVEMSSGWGLDYIWSIISVLHQKHIIRDCKYIVNHPEGSSYDHGKATAEMGAVLSRFSEFCDLKGWDKEEANSIFNKISGKMGDNNSVKYRDLYRVEGTFPYHIISLDEKRSENKRIIQEELGEENRIFIEVLDARVDLNLKEFMTVHKDFKVAISNPKVGEIGCFASHWLAWSYLVKSDLNYLLIFEDDARVGRDFRESLVERMSHVPQDYDVFSVYVDNNQDDRFSDKHFVSEFIARGYQDWSTLCYVVSKKGAEKLLKHFEKVGMDQPVDWYIFRNGELGIFNVYTPHPKSKLPLSINDVTGSQVQNDKFYLDSETNLYVEFSRFLENNGDSEWSQIQQDKFAAFINKEKPGYFVEFGACDGKHLSNTYLLEQKYGWTGILAEPSPYYFEQLKKNRKAHCEDKCVSSSSNSIVNFTEVDLGSDKGLSGITEYVFQDHHAETRRNNSVSYDVETISLDDLLNKYYAPEVIDYLSIDTEGSEFAILEAYSFSRRFKFISVEHNNTPNREKIFSLLTSHGYVRILPELSKWDDWYIKKDLL